MSVLAFPFIKGAGNAFEKLEVVVLLETWLLDAVARMLVPRHPHGTRLARHVLVGADEDELMMVRGVLPRRPYEVLT